MNPSVGVLKTLTELVGGINPVLEALRAEGRAVQRIYLAPGRSGAAVNEILTLAADRKIKVERVERSRLDRLFQGRGHQGVVALVGPYQYFQVEEIFSKAASEEELILILDGIQDPMNLGSLLRSAEAAGAGGVIIPRERAAPVSAAALKASSGAAEYMPVARTVNLARTLDQLKQRGFWIVGAEAGTGASLYDQELPGKTGLVIGGEGKGLRRLVREKCDLLVSIPMKGRVSSLNAAVAGALAMFEFVRQRRRPEAEPSKFIGK